MTDTTTKERLAELDRERAAIIDQDGAPASPGDTGDTGNAPARAQDVWPHDIIEMYGEQWQVRIPTQQALTAVTLSSGRYIPQQVQNDIVSLFLKNHMSEASFARLFERLSDPDDDEFSPETLGHLMRELSMRALRESGLDVPE